MKKPSRRSLLVASLTGVLAVPLAMATRGTTAAHDIEEVHCYGVNKCKGHNDCKSAENACKGKAACKGHGLVAMSKSACDHVGGKVGK